MAKNKSKKKAMMTTDVDWRAAALKKIAEGKDPGLLTKLKLDTLISEGLVTWVYRDGQRHLVDKAEFGE